MLKIQDLEFKSRLLLGTAKYPSLDDLVKSIQKSKTDIVTVSLRRTRLEGKEQSNFLKTLKDTGVRFLPNTSGCFSMKEIIAVSEMVREIFETNWIKLEAIGDDYTLFPDPVLLIESAKELIKRGFHVFPYTSPDIVVCQRLADAGCNILMPLAAPIGSGQGPVYLKDLERIRDRFPKHTLIVDAGIGRPSHAAQVMEMGYDAVLLNTAVAEAGNPSDMAHAFANAIHAGREAYLSGIVSAYDHGRASSPLIDQPFWHNKEYDDKRNESSAA